MEFVWIVALLAVAEYMTFGILAGNARMKHGVAAPATTGHPIFERYFRVQQNTLEQIVVLLPAMFGFATWVSPAGAALLGLVFIVGRVIYLRSYVADPAKRGAGFAVTALANVVLVLGGLIGAFVAWL
jgi:uncharacterized membrane protein YecN with MAPEG domain